MELIRAKLSHQSCHHLEELLVIQLLRAPGNVETIRNMTRQERIDDDKTKLKKYVNCIDKCLTESSLYQ